MEVDITSQSAWEAFLAELAADEAWWSVNAAAALQTSAQSPFHPLAKLRRYAEVGGAGAASRLIGLLADERSGARLHAVWGLELLGPHAGDDAVRALEAHLDDPLAHYEQAVAALEAIAPELVRRRGLHRKGFPASAILARHTHGGFDQGMDYVEWFVGGEADEDVEVSVAFAAARSPSRPATGKPPFAFSRHRLLRRLGNGR